MIMWRSSALFILRYRIPLLFIVVAATVFMAYHASKVELSYELAKVIPEDHPTNVAYQNFRKKFGEDGNLMVIGIQSNEFFTEKLYNDYAAMLRDITRVSGVVDLISVPTAMNLTKDPVSEKLQATPVFAPGTLHQQQLDSSKQVFLDLPFYRNLLYNPVTNAFLAGIRIDRQVLASPRRVPIVDSIRAIASGFSEKTNVEVHMSGLPFIRTILAKRIADEMRWFLLVSVIFSAIILLMFFRSIAATLLSLGVVIIGVIWSLGIMAMLDYKINLLTALIPPLIVVIGIPNCIYFLNKFHTAYSDTGDKHQSLISMVDKMGVVTLFCNIAAAIGFAVFALTRSEILKEFGLVAGVNIMILFFISLVLIPVILSFLPPPHSKHTKYLDNPRLNRWLDRLERWSLNHRRLIYIITTIVVIASVAGMFKLRSEGFIVDDLPKTDKIYTDLKFFEKHFTGVMPLEIVIDTKKRYGVSRNLNNIIKIDSFSQFLASTPNIGKPLSIAEGLRFAKQAFFEGDTLSYTIPAEYDLPALSQYLSMRSDTGTENANAFTRIISTFMDSARQQARITVNMADVGSEELPHLLTRIRNRSNEIFDTANYSVQFTGTSVTFLEGTSFIINGLKESIIWAFILIAACMLYLFRSWRILVCSLIPNIIPLLITAGVMGWAGVRLKPSTVLIFSVALGIAIDVTIRFLVNYKQELAGNNYDMKQTVIATIHSTGISIIYTSLVLIAGFVIFCFSSFGGTQSLGWLTSLTLITATLTNLVLLPALLITMVKFRKNAR